MSFIHAKILVHFVHDLMQFQYCVLFQNVNFSGKKTHFIYIYIYIYVHTTVQKFVVGFLGLDFFLKKSLLLTKTDFFWSKIFLFEYIRNVIYFCESKLYFQHHYSSLQCHMIFRNHSNMLIYCSRNISDYYQCWKQFCCFTFFMETVIHFF